MPLVHKSIDVRKAVWKKLRVNAELSDCALRDYLAYLVENSSPVDPEDPGQSRERELLQAAAKANDDALGRGKVAARDLMKGMSADEEVESVPERARRKNRTIPCPAAESIPASATSRS